MDINVLNMVTNSAKTIVSTLIVKSSPSDKILDPMSCIIRLAILAFKENKTKIGIRNNSLEFQYPNIFQGALRQMNGDTRSDLHYIHNPILKAIEWYDIEKIKLILEICKKGLIKLKKSYTEVIDSNLVCHSLSYYIKLIETKLSQTKKLDKSIILIKQNISETKQNEDKNIYDNNGIKKLKNIWSYKEIKLITDMFILINEYKQKNYNINNILNSIDIIIKGKDEIVRNLIIRLTRTLSN